ncbi:MAG: SH3 domain-containing protein [Bacteroidota bacterium]
MAKKKNKILPSMEVLIILVFFISFIAWAMKSCSETKAQFQEEELSEEVTTTAELTDSSTLTLSDPITADTTTATTTNASNPATSNTTSISRTRYAPLYVTIKGLKMRTEPSLESDVILQLNLFEQVNFMGEVTDSTYQINLGYEIADEPWVKVQHRRGKVGWVYGAGVNYYKKKREGVLE